MLAVFLFAQVAHFQVGVPDHRTDAVIASGHVVVALAEQDGPGVFIVEVEIMLFVFNALERLETGLPGTWHGVEIVFVHRRVAAAHAGFFGFPVGIRKAGGIGVQESHGLLHLGAAGKCRTPRQFAAIDGSQDEKMPSVFLARLVAFLLG